MSSVFTGLTRWRQRFAAACGAALLSLCSVCPAAAPVGPATLSLRWEVLRSVFSEQHPQGRSLSAFTLTNQGSQPLPAQGWSIYFNCVAGVELADVTGPFRFEKMPGTWYRFRPTQAATSLGAQQAVQLTFFHPEVMLKSAKAPTGPYIVFDSDPQVGHAIGDYRIMALTRPEQWAQRAGEGSDLVTAEETYRRNSSIVELPAESLAPVFPRPRQLERGSGSLSWSSLPAIVAAPALQREAALAYSLLKPHFAAQAPKPGQAPLRLLVAALDGQSSAEAYELMIDPVRGITLTGQSAAAVARGLQSLRELLPLPGPVPQGITLAAMKISDSPRFGYRGVQLDVARNFQPKATLLRLLDLMARYKLNKFHLHLTDDEGWRLDIPGLPELVKVGARRGHTLDSRAHLQPAYGSGPDPADAYGSGHYSAADYVEILRYAAARHIEVIPEIEMPGHARAAVKAMESRFHQLKQSDRQGARRYLLSDPDDQSQYRSAQLYTDNVMNPGLPSTYAFIERVIDAVVALHRQAGAPLRTIHVGADELPNGAWEKSPATQALMQREKLASTADVWDYFYDRVERLLRKRGLFASGWEELGARKVKLRGEDKLIPNPLFTQRGFHLYVWNDLDDAQDLAYRMANAGYRTILAPATHLYFDMAHSKNPDEPGVNWAGYSDLDTVFDFIPFDFIRKSVTDATPVPGRDGLTDYGQQNVLGLEGPLFTETVRDQALMDYLLMPRMLALAERAWSADPAWARETDASRARTLHDADWASFVNQLGQRVLPKLDVEYPGVLYRIAAPGLRLVQGQVLANHQLPGFTLRYSTDGSEPTVLSPLVQGPIAAKGTIRVAAFAANGRRGRSSVLANR